MSDEITVEDLGSALFIAKRRYATLAQNPSLTPQDVMRELVETVLPALEDTVKLVDKVEHGVVFAQEEIDRLDEEAAAGGGEPESQLLPEDAARFMNFFQAILEQSESSLRVLDPASTEAKALGLMATEAKGLMTLTNDLTITLPDDEDDEEEDDDDENEEEPASYPTNGSAPREGDG
jgi:hypothetical protein